MAVTRRFIGTAETENTPIIECLAEFVMLPVERAASHPSGSPARVQRPVEHVPGQLSFCRELTIGEDPSRGKMLENAKMQVIVHRVRIPVGRRRQKLHPARISLTCLLRTSPGICPFRTQEKHPHIVTPVSAAGHFFLQGGCRSTCREAGGRILRTGRSSVQECWNGKHPG